MLAYTVTQFASFFTARDYQLLSTLDYQPLVDPESYEITSKDLIAAFQVGTWSDDGYDYLTLDNEYLEFSYYVVNGTSLETVSAIYCDEYIEKYLSDLD